MKNKTKEVFIGLLIAIPILIADIFSKKAAFDFLSTNKTDSYEVLSFINIVTVHNTGVSFGMFHWLPNWFFIVVATIITICIFCYAIIKSNGLERYGFFVIAGGSIGNIYDRVFIGAVRDFIDLHITEYHWPAFNIADSAVCIGAGLFFLSIILNKDEKSSNT